MLRCCVSLLAVAGSLALTLPAPARAQAPESYARRGPYAGIAGSLGIYTGLENELPGDADVDNPIGVNGYVGYRVHSLFAVEVAGEWLPDADVDVFGSDIGSVETWSAMVNGKGYPFGGRIQPFGLVGLGVLFGRGDGADLDGTEYDFAARFGGGLDLYLTANLVASANITYVLPTGDLHDLDYVSIGWGLAWRF